MSRREYTRDRPPRPLLAFRRSKRRSFQSQAAEMLSPHRDLIL